MGWTGMGGKSASSMGIRKALSTVQQEENFRIMWDISPNFLINKYVCNSSAAPHQWPVQHSSFEGANKVSIVLAVLLKEVRQPKVTILSSCSAQIENRIFVSTAYKHEYECDITLKYWYFSLMVASWLLVKVKQFCALAIKNKSPGSPVAGYPWVKGSPSYL